VKRVALLFLLACGSRAPVVRAPAPTVKTEIELAEQAERQRKHDVARMHYEKAIAIAVDPASSAYARREFAETLASWGEVPEAVAHLERSVALVDDDPGAWHDLGILKHNRGDIPGATRALSRAKQLAPGDFRPRVALAALRWKTGDKASAKTEYEALLELELPDRLRAKVKWALGELAKP
jgi:Flp pilus assembly protein TadD